MRIMFYSFVDPSPLVDNSKAYKSYTIKINSLYKTILHVTKQDYDDLLFSIESICIGIFRNY